MKVGSVYIRPYTVNDEKSDVFFTFFLFSIEMHTTKESVKTRSGQSMMLPI